MTQPQPATEKPLELVVSVIREALACDRPQCTPQDHSKFVSENLRIAHDEMNVTR